MKTFSTENHKQRAAAAEFILNLDGKWMITIQEPKRSLVRNAQLHAALTDIAEQVCWHGEYHSVDDWKRLLTAAWMRATGRRIKLVPAADGSGVDVLYQRTSRLTEKECRELIQYVYAWGVDNNVVFKEPTPEGWKKPETEAA